MKIPLIQNFPKFIDTLSLQLPSLLKTKPGDRNTTQLQKLQSETDLFSSLCYSGSTEMKNEGTLSQQPNTHREQYSLKKVTDTAPSAWKRKYTMLHPDTQKPELCSVLDLVNPNTDILPPNWHHPVCKHFSSEAKSDAMGEPHRPRRQSKGLSPGKELTQTKGTEQPCCNSKIVHSHTVSKS